MSTNEQDNGKQIYRIRKEQPFTSVGKPMNWKAGWATFLLISFIFVFLASVIIHKIWVGGIYLVLALLFWGSLVWPNAFEGLRRTPIAIIYRRTSHGWRTRRGQNRFQSLEAEIGEVFGVKDFEPPPPKRFPLIGRVQYLPYHSSDGATYGGAWDHDLNTDSATLWVNGESWLSLDVEEQRGRFNAFAKLLDSMAREGSLIDVFAWQDQTLIGEYEGPEDTLSVSRLQVGADYQKNPLLEDYISQTVAMAEQSVVHHTTMTLALNRKRVGRLAKQFGGYERLLEDEIRSFHNLIAGKSHGYSPIGVRAAGFLTHNDRIIENRLKVDPVRGQWIHQQWERPDDNDYLLSERRAWPGSWTFDPWDYCVIGETVHIGYFLAEYPAGGMPPSAFWEILKVPVPKTVTVVFQMVAPKWARWRAELKTTGELGSNFDLAQAGRRIKEARRVAAEEAVREERALAEQEGQIGRVRAYIDVTGSSLEEAKQNARKLENGARDATFILEPLTGRQYEGISAVLPAARGLETSDMFR